MRKTLSDKGVAALKPRAARYSLPDPELRGGYIRVTPTGAKSYAAVTTDPHGKQIWATIGALDAMPIADARVRARQALQRIRDGLPPVDRPKPPNTFRDVAEQWLKRHVQSKGLRSEGEVTRLLHAYVYPTWGDRDFLAIRRSDVAELLDQVEDDHGARQADYVLAVVRGIANWFATRHDDYVPPMVRGMKRTSAKERERKRVLDDAELVAVWRAAERGGTFGAFAQLALLSVQRKHKIATMRWADIAIDGAWNIPSEDREKGTGGKLMLPPIALDIIRAQPRLGDNPYVLAGQGNGHISGFSRAKLEFDSRLANVAPWTIHDLRRTARSLMARAGVRPDIAERVMGHAIGGIQGVYDQHSYSDEKRDALARLAALIDGIVNPRPNVIAIVKSRKRK
jgi:integrase